VGLNNILVDIQSINQSINQSKLPL